MSGFSRNIYNPIVALQGQQLTRVHTALQSLIPQCGRVALVAIALQFSVEISKRAGQESATTICKELRGHVRGSDQVYLLQRDGQSGLFFLLPEADLEGGLVVHQRLQDILCSSVLPQIDGLAPQQIEIRSYALSDTEEGNQASLLIESPTYTDIVRQNSALSVRSCPTQPNIQHDSPPDSLLPPSPFLLSKHPK